jgi:hypothetical protein
VYSAISAARLLNRTAPLVTATDGGSVIGVRVINPGEGESSGNLDNNRIDDLLFTTDFTACTTTIRTARDS